MPELPEVEVIRQSISPLLVGRRLKTITTTRSSTFFLTPPATLRRKLVGRRALGLERRGKYLLVDLDDGARLLLHLGMTGQLFSSRARSPRLVSAEARSGVSREFVPDAHTHLVIAFTDRGPDLVFRDVRKFGKVRWLATGKSDPRLDKLGPDALSVSGAHLYEATRRRSAPIKTVLLDQLVLAGVGNIYADEALFLAGQRPTRRARSLTRGDYDRLATSVHGVLEAGIAAGGSSIDDFVRPDGEDGGYQHNHRVYGRAGQPCSRCGMAIRRLVIGQRSSCFCPHCQR